jgi:hypothetical protein
MLKLLLTQEKQCARDRVLPPPGPNITTIDHTLTVIGGARSTPPNLYGYPDLPPGYPNLPFLPDPQINTETWTAHERVDYRHYNLAFLV